MGYLSSRAVKKTLRERIYKKLLRLGASYNQQVKTSEVVQVAAVRHVLETKKEKYGRSISFTLCSALRRLK